MSFLAVPLHSLCYFFAAAGALPTWRHTTTALWHFASGPAPACSAQRPAHSRAGHLLPLSALHWRISLCAGSCCTNRVCCLAMRPAAHPKPIRPDKPLAQVPVRHFLQDCRRPADTAWCAIPALWQQRQNYIGPMQHPRVYLHFLTGRTAALFQEPPCCITQSFFWSSR